MKKDTFLKIAKHISPEFTQSYDTYKQRASSLKTQLSFTKHKNELFIAAAGLVNKILEHKSLELLGVEFSNDGHALVVYMEPDTTNEYNIIVEKPININENIGRREVYKLEFKFYDEEKKIYIIDNHTDPFQRNNGYGSIGLQNLKKVTQLKNYKKITGKIAPRDWDDVKLLEHFYSKNGFSVILKNESKSGIIIWENPEFKEIH